MIKSIRETNYTNLTEKYPTVKPIEFINISHET